MIIETTCHNLIKLKERIAALSEEEYARPLEVLNQSTIGMHVRHVLEFYECLLESKSSKVVNYDLRKRDITLEMQLDACLKTIEKIVDVISEEKDDFSIVLEADYCETEVAAPISLPTTYFRELLYNIEHGVHHMAIIKIGMRTLGKPETDENFGVAASTIRNKKICAQ